LVKGVHEEQVNCHIQTYRWINFKTSKAHTSNRYHGSGEILEQKTHWLTMLMNCFPSTTLVIEQKSSCEVYGLLEYSLAFRLLKYMTEMSILVLIIVK